MALPSYNRVRQLLDYDPDTGLFYWRCDRYGGPRGKIRAGEIAGHDGPRRYIEIRIEGYLIDGHRLAWFWLMGSLPSDEIDHKNTNRADNRWSNLRAATHSQNVVHKGPNKNNMLGVKGVRVNKGRYEARIWKDGKSIQIGRFLTVEQANAAYVAESLKLHGEFSYAAVRSS